MAFRSVRVAVSVIARQEALQGVDRIVIGACAGLDDGHSGGGVGNEDVAQPVATTGAELPHRVGQIHCRPLRGVDVEHLRVRLVRVRVAAKIDASVYFGSPSGYCCRTNRSPWRKK